MGIYNAWIATGETGPEHAITVAGDLCQRYDETENDIPGEWPGLSYDYCEIASVSAARDAVAAIAAGRFPDALVTADGQIRSEKPSWSKADDDYAPVSYGAEEMTLTLLEQPEQQVIVMSWHC